MGNHSHPAKPGKQPEANPAQRDSRTAMAARSVWSGIPTTQNKVLERAVVMLLEPIYEIDFIEGSYGFRRGRSAQKALESIRQWLSSYKGQVLDTNTTSAKLTTFI